MKGLPRHIIKKYGVSKKAWAVYRGSKASPSRIRKSVKVKTTTRRYKVAKRKSYRKSKSLLGNLNTPLMGAGGVVLYESLISPMIPVQGVAKDMLELVGGLYLSKKRGFLGATGKSLVTINSYQLISGMIGNKLQGLVGKSETPNIYGGY